MPSAISAVNTAAKVPLACQLWAFDQIEKDYLLQCDYFDRRDDKASTPDDLILVAGTILGMKAIIGD